MGGWRIPISCVASGEADAAASVTGAESAGTTAVDAGDDETAAGAEAGRTDAAAQPGSAELVLLGVLGGVYLLYSIGWLIWALSPAPDLGEPVAQFMFVFGRWMAVLAPALWFGVVLWLAAERHRARLIWLIAGAVLLVPVPFLLRG